MSFKLSLPPPVPRLWKPPALPKEAVSPTVARLLGVLQKTLPDIRERIRAGVRAHETDTLFSGPLFIAVPGLEGPPAAQTQALQVFHCQLVSVGDVTIPGLPEPLLGAELLDAMPTISHGDAPVLLVQMRWSDCIHGLADGVLRKAQGNTKVMRGLARLDDGFKEATVLSRFLACPTQPNAEELEYLASRVDQPALFEEAVESFLHPFNAVDDLNAPKAVGLEGDVRRWCGTLLPKLAGDLKNRLGSPERQLQLRLFVYETPPDGTIPAGRLNSIASQLNKPRAGTDSVAMLASVLSPVQVAAVLNGVAQYIRSTGTGFSRVQMIPPVPTRMLGVSLLQSELTLEWDPHPPWITATPEFTKWAGGNADALALAAAIISASGEGVLERLLQLQTTGRPVLSARQVLLAMPALSSEGMTPEWRAKATQTLNSLLDRLLVPPVAPRPPVTPQLPPVLPFEDD